MSDLVVRTCQCVVDDGVTRCGRTPAHRAKHMNGFFWICDECEIRCEAMLRELFGMCNAGREDPEQPLQQNQQRDFENSNQIDRPRRSSSRRAAPLMAQILHIAPIEMTSPATNHTP